MSSINFVQLPLKLVTMKMYQFLAIAVGAHSVTLTMNWSSQDNVAARHLVTDSILLVYATWHVDSETKPTKKRTSKKHKQLNYSSSVLEPDINNKPVRLTKNVYMHENNFIFIATYIF